MNRHADRQAIAAGIRRSPGARRTDPDSSHEAAARVRTTGRLSHQMEQVLALVRAEPGWTSAELSTIPGALERHQIARCLKPLEKAGLVRRPYRVNAAGQKEFVKRECRAHGGSACIWYPTETADQPTLPGV